MTSAGTGFGQFGSVRFGFQQARSSFDWFGSGVPGTENRLMGLDTKTCRDGSPSDITHVTSQTASQSDSHAAGRNGRAAMRALSLPNARTPEAWRNTQHHPRTDEANYHHVRPYAPSATQRRLDKQPLAFQSCQTPPMHHAAASSASSSVATGATSSTPCWSHARPPGPHTVPG